MKILVADDERVTLSILKSTLQEKGYHVITCTEGFKALEILRATDSPQLAILDWMMPNMDGVDICRKIREIHKEPYTYIIILTGKQGKQDVVTGLEAGADDYLSKPFDTHELLMRLRAGERILELQNQLINAREKIRKISCIDHLTNILNRGAIMEFFYKELQRSRRKHEDLSLIMVDIDHFKRVNDTYGHLTGDAVLKEVAQRLKSSFRFYDPVGRYGGEEFLVVLSDCDSDAACKQAERLRQIISVAPVITGGEQISITISLGVSTTSNASHASMDEIIQRADQALYTAKDRGRNQVVNASPV